MRARQIPQNNTRWKAGAGHRQTFTTVHNDVHIPACLMPGCRDGRRLPAARLARCVSHSDQRSRVLTAACSRVQGEPLALLFVPFTLQRNCRMRLTNKSRLFFVSLLFSWQLKSNCCRAPTLEKRNLQGVHFSPSHQISYIFAAVHTYEITKGRVPTACGEPVARCMESDGMATTISKKKKNPLNLCIHGEWLKGRGSFWKDCTIKPSSNTLLCCFFVTTPPPPHSSLHLTTAPTSLPNGKMRAQREGKGI